ncbi:hypothetical protein HN51_054034 [Arachis hypogaea]
MKSEPPKSCSSTLVIFLVYREAFHCMTRGPIPHDDDDTVSRKGKVVTTTEEWPEPPILLDDLIAEILLRIPARSLV